MKTRFNFKSQVCTDKNQSERLLALGLKKETADMVHYFSQSLAQDWTIVPLTEIETAKNIEGVEIPAWSLHRLMEMAFNSLNDADAEDEIKVLDNFLLRCWQMGWLERYEKPRDPLDIPTMTADFVKEHGLPCPNGYIFKDENGNVINATKIVLEKKRKEYPKTYEDCIMLALQGAGYNRACLLVKFEKLLTCRDAYWKIAGEEMGLGKPWKPDYDSGVNKFGIICLNGVVQESNPTTNWERHLNKILDFPTAEMRDAFYENFKELIEECKELL